MFVNGEVRGCPYFYPWLVNLLKTEWQPDLCLAVFVSTGFVVILPNCSIPLSSGCTNWNSDILICSYGRRIRALSLAINSVAVIYSGGSTFTS